MCGRYVRRSDKQRIAEHFHVYGPSVPDFGPSWNVAPQTFQPIVRLNRDTREREIVMMRWGLIPYWAKDPQIGLSTINAKAETVATAPSFREAFRTSAMPRSGRCLPGMAKDRCQDQEALCYRIEIW
jgi:putative SOS response-associated peptidase YedK